MKGAYTDTYDGCFCEIHGRDKGTRLVCVEQCALTPRRSAGHRTRCVPRWWDGVPRENPMFGGQRFASIAHSVVCRELSPPNRIGERSSFDDLSRSATHGALVRVVARTTSVPRQAAVALAVATAAGTPGFINPGHVHHHLSVDVMERISSKYTSKEVTQGKTSGFTESTSEATDYTNTVRLVCQTVRTMIRLIDLSQTAVYPYMSGRMHCCRVTQAS